MIKKCTCENKYQDERYGKQKRVHNPCKPKVNPKTWRCTSCNAEKH